MWRALNYFQVFLQRSEKGQRRDFLFNKKSISFLTVVALVIVMFAAQISEALTPGTQAPVGKGLTAIDRASQDNKYLFIFFYRGNTAQTSSMRDVFNRAMNAAQGRGESISVNVDDPSETGIVKKFNAKDAPMPLVLAVAPNGAITANFVTNFTERQVLEAFATPAMENLLVSLQQGKLVVLCVQNGKTRSNIEAMRGVQEFVSDQRFTNFVQVLKLDPSQPRELPFLAKLGMTSPIVEAETLLIAPPGSLIGNFKGATDKNQLIATLTKATSGGCGAGGCGAGGCGAGN